MDIESGAPKDLSTDGIMDLYATKWWAIKLATDAVITVLKVDQIIMAKQVRRSILPEHSCRRVIVAATVIIALCRGFLWQWCVIFLARSARKMTQSFGWHALCLCMVVLLRCCCRLAVPSHVLAMVMMIEGR